MLLRWLRHRLTALTTIWLFCQTLSLSALAPRYCCAAHSHEGESAAAGHQRDTSDDCHDAVSVADACPMAGAGGDACPMHGRSQATTATAPVAAASHDGHGGGTPVDDADCEMRGTCGGPVTALASLIWIPGILADAPAGPTQQVARLAPPPSVPVGFITRPIDLPPPRA